MEQKNTLKVLSVGVVIATHDKVRGKNMIVFLLFLQFYNQI